MKISFPLVGTEEEDVEFTVQQMPVLNKLFSTVKSTFSKQSEL